MNVEVDERWSDGDTENELASNMLLTIVTGTMRSICLRLEIERALADA